VGNFYIILKQIYSGNGVPNFTGIARVLQELLQKNVLVSFLKTTTSGSLLHIEAS